METLIPDVKEITDMVKDGSIFVELDTFNENLTYKNCYKWAELRDQHAPTRLQVALIKGDTKSKFVVSRLRVTANNDESFTEEWEIWTYLDIFVETKTDGTKGINLESGQRLHDSYNSRGVVEKRGEMEKHPTDLVLLGEFYRCVDNPYINVVIEEAKRLYENNIGIVPVPIGEYLVEEQYVLHKRNPFFYIRNLKYPGLHFIEESSVPYSLISHFIHQESIDVIKSIFGAENYRKDLVKACLQRKDKWKVIEFAVIFKNLVPIDWIIEMIKSDNEECLLLDAMKDKIELSQLNINILHKIFNSCTIYQKKKLFTELYNPSEFRSWAFQDTISMWEKLSTRYDEPWNIESLSIRNWMELHDFMSKEISMRATENLTIKKVPVASAIEALPKTEEFQLILPDKTHTLVKWGQDMDHCIGSYTDEAWKGSSVYVGIIQNGKMVGNAEIIAQTKKVTQVFGKHNSYLDKALLEKFFTLLIQGNVVPENAFDKTDGYSL